MAVGGWKVSFWVLGINAGQRGPCKTLQHHRGGCRNPETHFLLLFVLLANQFHLPLPVLQVGGEPPAQSLARVTAFPS